MTTEQPIITNYDGDSETFTPIAYECKFTVEGTGNVGGDWEHNRGGAHEQKRVTFEGVRNQRAVRRSHRCNQADRGIGG